MSLNSQHKQGLETAVRDENPTEECTEKCTEEFTEERIQNEEATLPLTEYDPDSDEPTQAFSPLYLEASGNQASGLDFNKLRLDSFSSIDPSARILLYPRISGLVISPYGGAGRYNDWVEVEMDDRPNEPVKVLVVAPSSEQLGCVITHDDVNFRLYFDPAQDRAILRNDCSRVILGSRLDVEWPVQVQPRQLATLYVGSWVIDIEGRALVDFQLLPRTSWAISARLVSKWSMPPSPNRPPKRIKIGQSAYRTTDASRRLQAISVGNALLKLGKGDSIHITDTGRSYQLTRHVTISDQANSSVWQAEYSKLPGSVVVVKVIKAASSDERHSVRAAESWMRESEIHSSLKNHPAILRMLGSDARFHSIYIEHMDAKSLVHLRQVTSDRFAGNASDTRRIFADIASALDFVHGSRLVHNDVKPGNILYSPSRGAVLIDFGLSFVHGSPSPTGGSPWYLPPEFMRDWRSRGPPCDVWALGVVALWLLGHLSLPEKSPSWLIADIHPSAPGTPSHLRAIDLMSRWLKQVENARSKISHQENPPASILRNTLAPEMKERIDAAALNQRVMEYGSKRGQKDKLVSE